MQISINFNRRIGSATAGATLGGVVTVQLPDDAPEGELELRLMRLMGAVTGAVNAQMPGDHAEPWDGGEVEVSGTVVAAPAETDPPVARPRPAIEPPAPPPAEPRPSSRPVARAGAGDDEPRTRFDLLDLMKGDDSLRKAVNRIAKKDRLSWKVTEWDDGTARDVYRRAVGNGVPTSNGRHQC